LDVNQDYLTGRCQMNDAGNTGVDHTVVTAVLEGGPVDLPEVVRKRPVVLDGDTIKILHRGGYEHFKRVADRTATSHTEPVIYQWIARTRIAE
jgi:hypothetical protein